MEYAERRASIWSSALLTVALLSAGCGHAMRSAPREPELRTTVRVQNHNFLDMNVYVLQGGQRIRLGTVPGLSTQVFTIPAHLVRNPPLQFEVHGIGGRGNPRTETISVQPGEEIQLTIPPS